MPLAHFSQSVITPTPRRKPVAPKSAPVTQAGSGFQAGVMPKSRRITYTSSKPTAKPITMPNKPRARPKLGSIPNIRPMSPVVTAIATSGHGFEARAGIPNNSRITVYNAAPPKTPMMSPSKMRFMFICVHDSYDRVMKRE